MEISCFTEEREWSDRGGVMGRLMGAAVVIILVLSTIQPLEWCLTRNMCRGTKLIKYENLCFWAQGLIFQDIIVQVRAADKIRTTYVRM